MKALPIALFSFILISPLVLAQTIGIGASPMKIEVGLGNETNTSNDIQFDFMLFNTGETPIRIIPVYVDEQLKNFSRPLIDELVVEPSKNGKFPILFFRNGTEGKNLTTILRFVAEPSITSPSGMVSVRPATDIKIMLIQKPMVFEEKKKQPIGFMAIIAILGVVSLVLILIINRALVLRSRTPKKF
jgi:hypothetical protein